MVRAYKNYYTHPFRCVQVIFQSSFLVLFSHDPAHAKRPGSLSGSRPLGLRSALAVSVALRVAVLVASALDGLDEACDACDGCAEAGQDRPEAGADRLNET